MLRNLKKCLTNHLNATVKEMVNTGQTLPDNLFNVYEAKIANVKIPKGE